MVLYDCLSFNQQPRSVLNVVSLSVQKMHNWVPKIDEIEPSSDGRAKLHQELVDMKESIGQFTFAYKDDKTKCLELLEKLWATDRRLVELNMEFHPICSSFIFDLTQGEGHHAETSARLTLNSLMHLDDGQKSRRSLMGPRIKLPRCY